MSTFDIHFDIASVWPNSSPDHNAIARLCLMLVLIALSRRDYKRVPRTFDAPAL